MIPCEPRSRAVAFSWRGLVCKHHQGAPGSVESCAGSSHRLGGLQSGSAGKIGIKKLWLETGPNADRSCVSQTDGYEVRSQVSVTHGPRQARAPSAPQPIECDPYISL